MDEVVEFYRLPKAVLNADCTHGLVEELLGSCLPDRLCGSILRGRENQPPVLSAIVDDLRFERYHKACTSRMDRLISNEAVQRLYDGFRPWLTDGIRIKLQRLFLRSRKDPRFPQWPVDSTVEQILEEALVRYMANRNLDQMHFIWFWPDGATAAAMLTHDVETEAGLAFVPRLMDIDDAFGIKSSFEFVPEHRYSISGRLLDSVRSRGHEINVHGLDHRGNLFRERRLFLEQAKCINKYARDFGAAGFRSPCMYRNLEWYDAFEFSYDMSVPNVAHLDPQRGGCCTVFPFFVGDILELPLTTIQDHSLLNILADYSIDLWKKQIDRILAKNGLISFIVHPDYLLSDAAVSVYKSLLTYLSALWKEQSIWIARAGEINLWWRQRREMELHRDSDQWHIRGEGCERARIAHASIQDGRIVYRIGADFKHLSGAHLHGDTFWDRPGC